MHRLICTFVVRIWHKTHFAWPGPIAVNSVQGKTLLKWRIQKKTVFFTKETVLNSSYCHLCPSWAMCFSFPCTGSMIKVTFDPCHEIMALFVPRKLILQMRMCSYPVGLDVWFFVGPFVYFHTSCANSEGSGETARMRRLAWAFAGRLYDIYDSWLICSWYEKNAACLMHVWMNLLIIYCFTLS